MSSGSKKEKTLLEYYTIKTRDSDRKIKKRLHDVVSTHTKTSTQLTLNGTILSRQKKDTRDGMFSLPTSPMSDELSKKKRKVLHSMNFKEEMKEQTYLDAGQKVFGHVVCKSCGMVYMKAQEDDEAYHAKHHDKIAQTLRFNGWKREHMVKEFHDGRIICVNSNDPPSHKKKLSEILEVVDLELSCSSQYNAKPSGLKGYLFVASNKVVGCAIAVPIHKAHPIIKGSSEHREKNSGELSWCCSSEEKQAVCGINRIWVFSQNRRQGIATRLIDAIRYDFIYGYVIEKESMAFSDPTPQGRSFAENYMGKSSVLVFR